MVETINDIDREAEKEIVEKKEKIKYRNNIFNSIKDFLDENEIEYEKEFKAFCNFKPEKEWESIAPVCNAFLNLYSKKLIGHKSDRHIRKEYEKNKKKDHPRFGRIKKHFLKNKEDKIEIYNEDETLDDAMKQVCMIGGRCAFLDNQKSAAINKGGVYELVEEYKGRLYNIWEIYLDWPNKKQIRSLTSFLSYMDTVTENYFFKDLVIEKWERDKKIFKRMQIKRYEAEGRKNVLENWEEWSNEDLEDLDSYFHTIFHDCLGWVVGDKQIKYFILNVYAATIIRYHSKEKEVRSDCPNPGLIGRRNTWKSGFFENGLQEIDRLFRSKIEDSIKNEDQTIRERIAFHLWCIIGEMQKKKDAATMRIISRVITDDFLDYHINYNNRKGRSWNISMVVWTSNYKDFLGFSIDDEERRFKAYPIHPWNHMEKTDYYKLVKSGNIDGFLNFLKKVVEIERPENVRKEYGLDVTVDRIKELGGILEVEKIIRYLENGKGHKRWKIRRRKILAFIKMYKKKCGLSLEQTAKKYNNYIWGGCYWKLKRDGMKGLFRHCFTDEFKSQAVLETGEKHRAVSNRLAAIWDKTKIDKFNENARPPEPYVTDKKSVFKLNDIFKYLENQGVKCSMKEVSRYLKDRGWKDRMSKTNKDIEEGTKQSRYWETPADDPDILPAMCRQWNIWEENNNRGS